MMKVVSVVDKTGTALDRLAKQVAPYHDNLEYHVVDFHPKRPDQAQIDTFLSVALDADIIDYQYFKSALKLREMFPWLKDKVSVLTHNNPYSYKEDKWEWANANVGNNNEITKGLEEQGSPNVSHIPITLEHGFWTYNREWKPNRTILMVANRIESKKGILPVAKAARNLGMKFVLVGSISDANYFREILQEGAVEFHEKITDEALRDLYYNSALHICNSVDNFESGTMPVLEAMMCGTPVISRNVGHVPDLNNGENIIINERHPDDVDHLETLITQSLADAKKLNEIRQSAWNTAKNFNAERRAFMYQKLYRSLTPGTPVSIILPIAGKQDVTRATLSAIADQTYPNKELIVIDDGEESSEGIVNLFGCTVNFPVRYIKNYQADYGLARARNKGIIEATSEILVFVDQRMVMETDAVEQFVKNAIPRKWLYGNKGGKKEFIENFSCVYKTDVVAVGMFNERLDQYGGMSQYIRSVSKKGSIEHVYIPEAKATPMGKSSNSSAKKNEITNMKNLLFKVGL